MARVFLESLSKSFGDVEAVRGLTLEIGDGEFFSLLGPSGCGKTTTLRLVAGFEEPSSGRIFLGDREMTQVPAHKRPVNTVFQSYALFPHLNVADNVAFGLRFKNVGKAERKRRVAEALSLVRLEGFDRRKPSQLSGGQQQRVALARALVLEPAVLLLDEPLGALDAKLRRSLQLELKSIQQAVGITFVYVTHDQEEALTMSDRMVVMADGVIQQLGTPREVYEAPRTEFVADFLGVSNLMSARSAGPRRAQLGETVLLAEQGDEIAEGDVRLTIRPERVLLEPAGREGVNRLPGRVARVVYLGAVSQVFVELPDGSRLQASASASEGPPPEEGSAVTLHLPPEALRVLAPSAQAGS
ncbi:MAG TPA: ABC transporter ATP-binding protein [Gaiellaceae bacterium]|nr:ABC transporter ATP-binding protein [Gaiellaceae bacterium]